MNNVFPRYKCDLKRWRWEFKENPYGSLQIFGDSEGKIVGHMGLIGVPIKLDNTTVQGSQAVDLAVAPEFRGRGMFVEIGKKLMQEAKNKGFTVSYGVPNEPAYGGHLKYGWFYVSEIPVLTKMISRKSLGFFALAKLRDLLKQPLLSSISNFMILLRDLIRTTAVKSRKPLGLESFRKRIITSFDDQFDRLWREVSAQHKFLIVRDKTYLNWRYIKRPYSNYVILAVERNDTIEGYVVLSTEVCALKKGYIVDMFAKSEESIRLLIQLACDYFAEESADFAVCWMMKNQLPYSCLLEHGFVNDTSSSTQLICRINTSDSAFNRLYRSVERDSFFTIGDSDQI
jgi:GNAT superfamily N-acetyltransferase